MGSMYWIYWNQVLSRREYGEIAMTNGVVESSQENFIEWQKKTKRQHTTISEEAMTKIL